MDVISKMKSEEVRDLLNKGWMTHDAMWFINCLSEVGIERTNKINRAAIRGMSGVEVKRIKKAIGIGDFDSFDSVKRLLEGGFDIIKGEFMGFKISFPDHNLFKWEVPKCFAYDGISSMGAIGSYECGIVDRPNGWFDTLGIKYTCNPDEKGCLMHLTGKCVREYRFEFKK